MPDTHPTAAQVADATDGVTALVRYLHHATRAGTTGALEYAGTLHDVVGSFEDAVHGLKQLLGQLGDTVDNQVLGGGLYDDRDGHEPVDTAGQAAYWLGSPATQAATELAVALQSAQQHIGHPGNHTNTE